MSSTNNNKKRGRPGRPARLGRPGRADAFYAQIAREYDWECRNGSTRPVQSIAEARHLSPAKVRDMLRAARHRGLLAKTTRGRGRGGLTPKGVRTLGAIPVGEDGQSSYELNSADDFRVMLTGGGKVFKPVLPVRDGKGQIQRLSVILSTLDGTGRKSNDPGSRVSNLYRHGVVVPVSTLDAGQSRSPEDVVETRGLGGLERWIAALQDELALLRFGISSSDPAARGSSRRRSSRRRGDIAHVQCLIRVLQMLRRDPLAIRIIRS